jgi:hypothetical protein
LKVPWYERCREMMGEPWRPRLEIEKQGHAFTFRYDGQVEAVHQNDAVARFAELVCNPPYYVRTKGDWESSRLFSYLQYCYFNGMAPDGSGFESITDRCGY